MYAVTVLHYPNPSVWRGEVRRNGETVHTTRAAMTRTDADKLAWEWVAKRQSQSD